MKEGGVYRFMRSGRPRLHCSEIEVLGHGKMKVGERLKNALEKAM